MTKTVSLSKRKYQEMSAQTHILFPPKHQLLKFNYLSMMFIFGITFGIVLLWSNCGHNKQLLTS